MLQNYAFSFKNSYRLCDLLGTFMPSADKAEWLVLACLNRAGSSGYLGPDASVRILE